MFRRLIEVSGKVVLLDKLLPRLHERGHKVLIFSQMVRACRRRRKGLSLKALCSAQLSSFEARLWICREDKCSADHIQSRASNSPN